VLPPFYAREESLGTGTVTVHGVERPLDGIFRDPRLLTAGGIYDSFQAGDQVFCPRQHKHIGAVVMRQAFLGFAHDPWNGELPA
jgi:hypothetical protein